MNKSKMNVHFRELIAAVNCAAYYELLGSQHQRRRTWLASNDWLMQSWGLWT